MALIGKPNVGKSSLLNRLAGQQRVLVDEVAGTTRDPVDELIELGGVTWRFVDTAGIRRRARESQGADFYAGLRTAGALERAEVAVVLVDASEPLTEQDLRIVSMVIEAGRALVLAFNKWDLVDEDRRLRLDRDIDRQLHTARWAPRVNISAATGRHVEKLVPALETALAGWETRVPTGRLNAWLADLVAATPPPARGGRVPRILFATQAGIRPPHFVLFTSGFLEAGVPPVHRAAAPGGVRLRRQPGAGLDPAAATPWRQPRRRGAARQPAAAGAAGAGAACPQRRCGWAPWTRGTGPARRNPGLASLRPHAGDAAAVRGAVGPRGAADAWPSREAAPGSWWTACRRGGPRSTATGTRSWTRRPGTSLAG